VEFVDESKELRVKLMRTVQQWRNRRLAQVFDRLYENARRGRSQRGRLARVVSHWQSRGVSRVFRRWVELVEESKELRVKLMRTVQQWRNRQVSSVFVRWAEFTAESKSLRVRFGRFVKVWAKRTLFKAFHALRAHRVTSRALRRRIAEIWRRRSLLGTSVMFHCWARVVGTCRLKRGIARHAERLLAWHSQVRKHRQLRAVLSSWRGLSLRRKRLYNLGEKAQQVHVGFCLRHAMKRWRRFSMQAKACVRLARAMGLCMLRPLFLRWQQWLQAERLQSLALSLPPKINKKMVSRVTKHFLSIHNIRTRMDLEQHRAAHRAELDGLQVRARCVMPAVSFVLLRIVCARHFVCALCFLGGYSSVVP
jgi:hypothetical protein